MPRRLVSEDGVVMLRLEIANPVSPKSLGLSADPRRLGLHLVRLEAL